MKKTLTASLAMCLFSGCVTESSPVSETEPVNSVPKTIKMANSQSKSKASNTAVGRTAITSVKVKSPFPPDDIPTDITAQRPSGKVKDPFAKEEPKTVVQPDGPKINAPIKQFGACGDEPFTIENVPQLVTNFHYDFEADLPAPYWDFQGWTAEGTYKLPFTIDRVPPNGYQVPEGYYADSNSERLTDSFNNHGGYGLEGAISFQILSVSYLHIDSGWIYTDFVSPRFTEADQSWLNIDRFEFIIQGPVSGYVRTNDNELVPYPGDASFLAQLLIEVEECDGTDSFLWQEKQPEQAPVQPVLCRISDYQTQCTVQINLSDTAIRKIKQLRLRVFQEKKYEYTLDDETQDPVPVISLLDFKGIE
ncbi:hypothetical protein [Thalassotalea maritima]|uniref:hypothetical protein n=1 Tax=Thalassotalea maritima TaxID=3242416 RepID=UPI00352805EC